jgi:hypothetical protein
MTLRPEVRQLVDLIASPPGERRERLLASVTDWPSLISNAIEWRMVSPLHDVAASAESPLPDQVTGMLAVLTTQRALYALRQTRQLGEILQVFTEAGIAALSYKGPTLAFLATGHLGGREFSDLDLLVHPRDYRKAADVLIAEGFSYSYPPPTRCQLRQAYEVCMVHKERRVIVDLHRSFFADGTAFSLTFERYHRHIICLADQPIPTLDPTELLLLLSVHGSKHCWRELRWIHDLHGLLSRQTFDWPAVLARARKEGAMRSVSLGLTLAHDLFGTPLPELFQASPATRRLVEESKGYLGQEAPGLQRQHLYHWRMFDTLPQRLRYLVWTVFFPHELDLGYVDLPESLYPLYFLIRPYRVVRERLKRGLPRRS